MQSEGVEEKSIRNLQHQYYVMSTQANDSAHDYREKMLEGNNIPGLLMVRIEQMNDKREFYYQTDGMRSLEEVCQDMRLGSEEISNLIVGLIDIIRGCVEFFLDEDDVVVSPAAVHITSDFSCIRTAYFPGFGEKLRTQFSTLLEYLMEKLDYNDKNASYVVYSVYAKCKRENITLDELSAEAVRWREESAESFASAEMLEEPQDVSSENLKLYDEQIIKPEERKISRKTGADSTCKKKTRVDIGKHMGTIAGKLIGRMKDSVAEKIRQFLSEEDEIEVEEEYIVQTERTQVQSGMAVLRGFTETVAVTESPFFIGRIPKQCGLVLDQADISRFHARIEKKEEGYSITDLSSSSGTFINGIRLTPGFDEPVMSGDEIRFGGAEYTFIMNQ